MEGVEGVGVNKTLSHLSGSFITLFCVAQKVAQEVIGESFSISSIGGKIKRHAIVLDDGDYCLHGIVCRELGIEEKYCPEGVFIFLRFGTRGTEQHRKEGRNPRQWYSIYATHGSGGGRKEGAKAIRLADMASIIDADIYIHSHTHLPMVMKEDFYRADSSNCAAHKISKLFVNTSAALTYGGYGQSYEFKPSSIHSPIIHLEAKHKRATATL